MSETTKSIFTKLMHIQTKIKAPKNLYNSFGKYKYRNAEGICEAVKPFLTEEDCALILTDSIVEVGGRVYVEATATLVDNEFGNRVSVSAMAREAEEKKGMDESQITGTASSYARKYALNGLFLLDDTKDADSEELQTEAAEKAKKAKEIEKEEQEKAEFEKKAAEIAKQRIDAVKVESIKKLCADDDVPEEKVLNFYKLKSFNNMTEEQFAHAHKYWQNIKEMKK